MFQRYDNGSLFFSIFCLRAGLRILSNLGPNSNFDKKVSRCRTFETREILTPGETPEKRAPLAVKIHDTPL